MTTTTTTCCSPAAGEWCAKMKTLLGLEGDAERDELVALFSSASTPSLVRAGVLLDRLIVSKSRMGLGASTVLTLRLRRGGGKDDADSAAAALPAHRFKTGEVVRLLASSDLARLLAGRTDVAGFFMTESTHAASFSSTGVAFADGVVCAVKTHSLAVAFKFEPEFVAERQAQGGQLSVAIALLSDSHTIRLLTKTVDRLQALPPDRDRLRRVFFDGEQPRFSSGKHRFVVDASGDAGDDRTVLLHAHNRQLNSEQRRAIEHALDAVDVAVIHGPPGTGKSTALAELIYQATVRLGLRVLAVAPSNVAVDSIVEKLGFLPDVGQVVRIGHAARINAAVRHRSLDHVVDSSDGQAVIRDIRNDIRILRGSLFAKSSSAERALSKKDKGRLHDILDRERQQATSSGGGSGGGGNRRVLTVELASLRSELRTRERRVIAGVLERARVVCTTTTLCQSRALHDVADFDLVVVDEAAQALEPAAWSAMLKGGKVVFAGDHRQLPPTIKSSEAAKQGLGVSAMERLVDGTPFGRATTRMLSVQYRMHADIMAFPSRSMYDGRLVADPSVAGHLLRDLPGVVDCELTRCPLAFVDTSGCDCYEEEDAGDGCELDSPSKRNPREAALVAAYVDELIVRCKLQPRAVAVITPYNGQVELLRGQLSARYPDLEIGSVDGFQGREKEAILISFVRANPDGVVGFLAEDRRTNVAITRARRHLALFGDSETLVAHPYLERLVEHCSPVTRSALEFDCIANASPAPRSASSASASVSSVHKHTKPASRSRGPAAASSSSPKPAPDSPGTRSQKLALRKAIDEFRHDPTETTLTLPTSLSSYLRLFVHKYCEDVGLEHRSSGKNESRTMLISKLPIPPAAIRAARSSVEGEQEPVDHLPNDSTSNNQSINIDSTSNSQSISIDSTSDSQSINIDSTSDSQSINNTDSQSINNTESQLINDTESQLILSEEGQDNAASSGQAVDSSSSDDESPAGRPERRHQRRQASPSAQQQRGGGAGRGARGKAKAEPSSKAKPSQAKPSKAKTESSGGRGGSLTDGRLLGDGDGGVELKDEAGVCSFRQCRTRVGILGVDCSFCKHRFCFPHGQAESHGCGEAAKRQARREWIGQHTPAPETMSAEKKDALKSRLKQRISAGEAARAPKKKPAGGGGGGGGRGQKKK